MSNVPDTRLTAFSSGVENNTTHIIGAYSLLLAPHRLGSISDCICLAGRVDRRMLSFSRIPVSKSFVHITEDAGEMISLLLSGSVEATSGDGIFSPVNMCSHWRKLATPPGGSQMFSSSVRRALDTSPVPEYLPVCSIVSECFGGLSSVWASPLRHVCPTPQSSPWVRQDPSCS